MRKEIRSMILGCALCLHALPVWALTEMEQDDMTEFSGPGWRDETYNNRPRTGQGNEAAIMRDALRRLDEQRLEKPPQQPWKAFPAAKPDGADQIVLPGKQPAAALSSSSHPVPPDKSLLADIVACLPEAAKAFEQWWTPENREKLLEAGARLLEEETVRQVLLYLLLGFVAFGFVLYLLIDLVFALFQALVEGLSFLGAAFLRRFCKNVFRFMVFCGASPSDFRINQKKSMEKKNV